MAWINLNLKTEIVESPCIGVCTLDDHGNCMGCRRSSEEITEWLNYTDEQRQAVIDALEQRDA